MASTGDEGSEAKSLDRSPSPESSVNAGAESNIIDVEEAQHDPLNATLPDHTHSEESEDDERENRFQDHRFQDHRFQDHRFQDPSFTQTGKPDQA